MTALITVPLKMVNGVTILMRDVAQVRDGSQVQQNIVRSDGSRSVLLTVLKNGASTLTVVNNVKRALAGIRAAASAGLMILLFLGSWRSTLIVLVSIPLAILTSLAVLTALGETINIMTLGGLALVVGILVDDATVAIKNTYRLLEGGKDFRHAVVEGRPA